MTPDASSARRAKMVNNITDFYLAKVKRLRGEEEALQKELRRLTEDNAKLLAELREVLEEGRTTGDPLLDLVIRAYGLNEPLTEKFRTLQEQLKGKKGEFVIIRYHRDNPQTMFPARQELRFKTQERFRIGVLEGEELRLGTGLMDNPVIELPVAHYVRGTWPQARVYAAYIEDEPPAEGSLFTWMLNDIPDPITDFLEPILVAEGVFGGEEGRESSCNRLLVGDEVLRKALAEVRDEKFFGAVAGKLSRLVLEPTPA